MDQHLAAGPKRKKRGPDRAPRKLPPQCQPRDAVPLEDVGAGPGAASLETGTPTPLAVEWQEPPAAFDQETAGTMVDLAIGLLNDSAGAVVRAVAKKETGDDVLAATAAESVQMTDRVEATIKLGAIQCARKYSVSMKYAPEVMLGGGLLIWAGQVKLAIHSLKQKGAELRERKEQPKA